MAIFAGWPFMTFKGGWGQDDPLKFKWQVLYFCFLITALKALFKDHTAENHMQKFQLVP